MRRDGGSALVRAAYVIDARPSAGLGHLTRSVALAHAVAPSARETTLYLHGGSVVPLGVGVGPDWAVHATHSPEEDVLAWSRRAEGSTKILVVDDPHTSLTRERDTYDAIQVIASFVDGAPPKGTFDVVINGTAYAEEIDYSPPIGTVACFGLDYACLRPELRAHRRGVPKVSLLVRRILVTLGGADPRALTPAVTEVAAQVLADRPDGATIDVVVGPGSTTADATTNAAARNERVGVRTCVHRGLGNIAPLMSTADLAISAGGGTLYELAFLGVPTISLPQTPDEERNARAVARSGACMAIQADVGWQAELVGALSMLVGDRDLRKRMSSSGAGLIDGRGPERLAEALLSSARRRLT